MKKSLIVAVPSLALASSAFSTPEIKVDPDYGNRRIIFAAQFPNKGEALQEALNAGGSFLGAETQCFAKQDHFESVYGKGACERIKELAPDKHALESRSSHIFWCYVAPAIAVKLVVVGGIATFCGLRAYHKSKRA